jgi:DNA helicase HerA-like ATPase
LTPHSVGGIVANVSERTFQETIQAGYDFGGETLLLGAPLREGVPQAGLQIRAPLAMLNRHGLVAGATGTGKTRTLQLLTDQLSAAGVPVFLADMKGDLGGLGVPGASNAKIEARATAVGAPFVPRENPVEFLSLSGANGIPLRATVSSFGPLLLARALDLNDTQQSVLTLVFKFCDDRGLLLLDLADLRAVLQYLTGEGAKERAAYGGMSKATVGVLLRGIMELEAQGGDRFFGEPEFEVEDLMRTDPSGRGIVSILGLADLQDRPALFSTFMMWLLASLYRELPEAGDLAKPKLVFFFDEAHLLFEEASKPFRNQVEQVVKLIRSKGVGVFFVTQTPKDVPTDVLSQLGNRVQHALRAFTPDDHKALKATADTFPISEFYDIPKTLTSLGIGEAIVTVLDARGRPTPVAATLLAPPASLMGPLPAEEILRRAAASPLHEEYAVAVARRGGRCRAGRGAGRTPPHAAEARRGGGPRHAARQGCGIESRADRGSGAGAGPLRRAGRSPPHDAPPLPPPLVARGRIPGCPPGAAMLFWCR